MSVRIAITLLLGIVGFFLFGFALSRSQSHLFLINTQEEMSDSADYIMPAVSNCGCGVNPFIYWMENNHGAHMNMLDYMWENDPAFRLNQDHLRDISSLLGTQGIMMIDRNGKVLASVSKAWKEMNSPRCLIRVTKLYHVDNRDVKIIPNKEIHEALHLFRYPTCLHLEYMIGYSEDLERVEKLLCAKLDTMMERMPELTDVSEYRGVQTLGDNGASLRVDVRRHEAHRPVVTRKVNRCVYVMFCRNGISVPFPQITVHNADKD